GWPRFAVPVVRPLGFCLSRPPPFSIFTLQVLLNVTVLDAASAGRARTMMSTAPSATINHRPTIRRPCAVITYTMPPFLQPTHLVCCPSQHSSPGRSPSLCCSSDAGNLFTWTRVMSQGRDGALNDAEREPRDVQRA